MTADSHLLLKELTISPATEWFPPPEAWTVMRVAEGLGYVLQSGRAQEIAPGDMVVVAGAGCAVLRASALTVLRLDYYLVHPEWLNGLLTIPEGQNLGGGRGKAGEPVICLAAADPVARKFARLAALSRPGDLSARTALLQLWSQAVALALPKPKPDPAGAGRKLRERFRCLLAQLPHAEMARLSLGELSARLQCSERHFSRLFRKEYGVAFRQHQTTLRLQRASELLAASNEKVSAIALQSGYRHIGLFNVMFKRRFGLTPKEWRAKIMSASRMAVLYLFVT